MLIAADSRELHHRRRNDVNLNGSEDERGIRSDNAEFGKLRCQRLLNRQEQLRGSVAIVRDAEQVLLFDQRLSLGTSKGRNPIDGGSAFGRQMRHVAE